MIIKKTFNLLFSGHDKQRCRHVPRNDLVYGGMSGIYQNKTKNTINSPNLLQRSRPSSLDHDSHIS